MEINIVMSTSICKKPNKKHWKITELPHFKIRILVSPDPIGSSMFEVESHASSKKFESSLAWRKNNLVWSSGEPLR